MPSPTVASITTTSFATAATAHLVSMPASTTAGELLHMGFNATLSGITVTTPTGWSITTAVTSSGTTAVTYSKNADGTEGGTTVGVTTGTSSKADAEVYRIQGWGGNLSTDVVAGTPATGTSTTNPAPPSVSWTWGSLDNLIIVWTNYDIVTDPTVAPTNYTNLTSNHGSSASGISSARRAMSAAASPEAPGTFTQAASSWVTNTIAIKSLVQLLPRRTGMSQAVHRAAYW